MRIHNFPAIRRHGPSAALTVLAALLGATASVAMPAVVVEGAPIEPSSRIEMSTRFAQANARHPRPDPRGRPVSDHDHARQSARSGENRSFDELMRSAHSRGRGEYLGVEPDISRNIYRFKFLRPGGNVVWVDVDGRTARVVSERD